MQWVLKQKQAGFTIVELLVIIVVIAILAAVAAVSYNGITDRARTLAIPNSLNNAAPELQRLALRGSIPTTLPSTINPDNDVVLHLAASPGGSRDFCINAYRISSYEVSSYDSRTGKIQPHLCAGVLRGSPVGGSLPSVPLNTNLIASDFADWELTGGVTYNESTKELTFTGTTGKAVSPPVYVGGASATTRVSYELYSSVASTTYAPQAGAYTGSAYYGADGTTSVLNSGGYPSNGNAQAVPLNAWTSRQWITPSGPNVHYVRYNINLAPSSYTSNNFKVRNPIIDKRS